MKQVAAGSETQCLDEGVVLAWMEGRLDDATRHRAQEHLDACATCLEIVAELSRGQHDPGERYEIGDEIARGGMGRVLAAIDRLLDRRVALKVMKAPVAGLHARFAREMRITARLQHPAIVPIYDAGTLPSGEPFYAMRMIAGRALDRAIEEAATLDDRMALIPAVVAVAEAIAYAHDEGVLHRDLKPQNVIVGPFGETVLLDWGLAKDRRAPDEQEPTRLALGSGTQAGEVLGTPAYMAPEQLRGDPVDERSDVYGLGGILYHVLCGVAPHEGPSPSSSSSSVRAERIVPVDVRQPDAPPELVAIAMRALAADPAARYPSAAELAGDLKRFQTGALVHAHRYTFGELARKWIARHRVALAVGAISLVCVIALSIVGVRKIVAERAQAQRERDRAGAQRDAAEKLVGFVLNDLRDRLEKVGRIDVLAGVGEEVDAYYGRVDQRGAADLVRRASALRVLGDAHSAGGDLTAALAAYRRALDAARTAGDGDARCRAHQRIGDLLVTRGELDAAAAEHQACVELARAGFGPTSAYQLGASLTELGVIARLAAEFDRASAWIEEALRIAEAIPGDEGVRLRVKATEDLGLVAIDRGDVVTAARLFAENLERVRRYVEARSDDPYWRRTLGVMWAQIGRVEMRRGNLEAAEQAFIAARDLWRALVDRDPANVDWLRDLSVMESLLSDVDERRDQPEAALAHARESHAVAERLYRMDPGNVRWARDLSASELDLAMLARELGRLDDARARALRSLELTEQAVRASPQSAEGKRDLAVSWLHIGDIEIARKDAAAARAALDRSASLYREILAAEDTPRARRELATILLVLHDVPAATRDERAVRRRAIDEARALIEPIRPLAADNAEVRDTIAEIDDAWAKLNAAEGVR